MGKSELIKKDKKNKKIIIFFISLIIIIMSLFLFKEKDKISSLVSDTPNQKSFVFKTIQGETFEIIASPKKFKIPKLNHKIVFLKVFGWDCKYCQKEIPELIKLKKQFDGAFDILAIESQHHSKEEDIKYIKEKGINYHVIAGDDYQDFLEYLKKYHGWNEVIPLSIVIGEDGRILAFEIGAKSYTLAELLKVSLQQYKMIKQLQQNKE